MERRLSEPPRDALDRALERLGPHAARVDLSYRATRRQIFAWRKDPREGVVRVTAHRALKTAPPEIADALWGVVLGRAVGAEARRLTHILNAWFLTRPLEAEHEPVDGGQVGAAAGHVDLRRAFDHMRAARLDSAVDAEVRWAARPSKRVFARYERGAPVGRIVVNPLLDAPVTPAWYVDFLLFHEALHAVFPPKPARTRMLMHPPEFRAAEKAHPEHARSRAFERWATGEGRAVLARRSAELSLLPAELR